MKMLPISGHKDAWFNNGIHFSMNFYSDPAIREIQEKEWDICVGICRIDDKKQVFGNKEVFWRHFVLQRHPGQESIKAFGDLSEEVKELLTKLSDHYETHKELYGDIIL